MLLKCCLLHTHMTLPRYVVFCIFVSMLTFRSINCTIYLSIWFSLSLQLSYNLIKTATLFYLDIFCQKFSFTVVLRFCLFFCKFQFGIAYKSVTYKKACNPIITNSLKVDKIKSLKFTLKKLLITTPNSFQ